MSRRFVLYTQKPKAKKIGIGVLDVDGQKKARLFEGDGEAGAKLLGELDRVRLERVGADGMCLSGMEPIDLFRTHFRYQEWWLAWEL